MVGKTAIMQHLPTLGQQYTSYLPDGYQISILTLCFNKLVFLKEVRVYVLSNQQ